MLNLNSPQVAFDSSGLNNKSYLSEQIQEIALAQKRTALLILLWLLTTLCFLYGVIWFNVNVESLGFVTGLCGVIGLVLIYLHKLKFNNNILTHLGLSTTAIMVYVNALYLWPVSPIVTNYFTLIPIVSLLLAGRRSAFVWSGTVMAFVLTLPYFSASLHLTVPVSAQYLNIYNFGQMFTIILTVLFLVLILDQQANERLKFMEEQRDILNRMQAKLIHTQQFRNRFFASISHEIRTPMNAVHGISEILSHSENLPEEDLMLIRSLGKSSSHLLGLISDLLDLSKLEEDKMQLVYSDFDLRELVYEAISIVRYAAHGKNLETRMNVHADLPKYINSDPNRLRQVLVNLLNNAIKFTQSGHVALYADCVERDGQRMLKIEIEDTGIGIPVDKQQSIFSGYEQADVTTQAQYGGTGLGLYISKRIIELLDGIIQVHSVPNQGSTFSIEIPVVASKYEQQIVEKSNRLGLSEDAKTYPYRILLVEDNQLNTLVAKRLIGNALLKCVVQSVENGYLAVEFLKNCKEVPDVVLMDLQMPVMGGLEATACIRAMTSPDCACVPIIAMTANASNDDRQGCIEAGMDDFVSKPLDVDLLLHKIVHLTHRTQQAKGMM